MHHLSGHAVPPLGSPSYYDERAAPKSTGPLAKQARHPAVLEDPAAGLAGRAVEDGVLLVVDLPQRVAAPWARLAEPAVDEVDVLVALAREPQLERPRQVLFDCGGEPLDLGVVESCRRARTATAARDGGSRSRARARSRRARAGRAGANAAAGCRPRGSRAASRRRARAPPGPRCASSASSLLGRLEPDACALLLARPRSARARRRSRSGAGTSASSAPSRRRRGSRIRPALIRWTRSASVSSAVGKRRHLPRLPAPGEAPPSSSRSGGSNVFSVAMCAGPACSTGAADTSGSSSRTHASTSGSSGMRRTVQRGRGQSGGAAGSAPAVAGTSPPAASASDGSGSSTGSGISRRCRMRGEQDRQERERHPDRADQIVEAQADPRGERAAEQRSERDRAPDDEAHHRVHPALQPLGG